MKSLHRVAWAAVLCLAALSCQGQDPTNVRVQKVLKGLVASNNSEVVGLGSWISGKKYNDPLAGGASDHDMRLLLPQGTSPENALEQWRATRASLTERIRAEFGKDADRILGTINLYPPTQLVQGVEDGADAAERFIGYGTVPNLGYTGAVDASMEESMARKLTEGLYGPGASAFTQDYEESAGRLFYSCNGKGVTGMTDLVHETEGVATYSASGLGNTSLQWVEHAEEAMRNGNGKSLGKYLDRLQRDLLKGRDLARCPITADYLKQLKAAAAALDKDPSAAEAIAGKISGLLERAQIEASLLRQYDDAGEAQQAMLKAALGSLEGSGGIGATLLEAAGRMPVEQLVEGMMAAVTAAEAGASLGAGDSGAAAVSVSQLLLPLGPALMAQLTNQIMDAARDAGFSMAANSQDVSDLLAGIFTAGGSADAEATGYTLDQIVAGFWTEPQLRAFVEARAQQAADRGWGGTATRASDAGVADAIVQRCYPRILGAWRARRDALTAEFKRLEKQLATDSLLVGYAPIPAAITADTPQAKVTVSAQGDPGRGKKIDRMKAIATALMGKRARSFWVSVDSYWLGPSDQKEVLASSRSFTFDSPGTYRVALRSVISSGGLGLPGDSPLATWLQRKAYADVVVAGPPSPLGDFAGIEKCSGVILNASVITAQNGFSLFGTSTTFGPDQSPDAERVLKLNNVKWTGTGFACELSATVIHTSSEGGEKNLTGDDEKLTITIDFARKTIRRLSWSRLIHEEIPYPIPTDTDSVIADTRDSLEFTDLPFISFDKSGSTSNWRFYIRSNSAEEKAMLAHISSAAHKTEFRRSDFSTNPPKVLGSQEGAAYSPGDSGTVSIGVVISTASPPPAAR
jgi:hypothetical protein